MRTIFVSIASYRDRMCSRTLSSLYAEAKNPSHVYVGICQQNNHATDTDCVLGVDLESDLFQEWIVSNVRILRIPNDQAQGPTFARYYCSLLYNQEDFFFQIDSHSLFTKHWDERLITMMDDLQFKYNIQKPVISHYCDIYENYSSEPLHGTVTTMTSMGLEENHMIFFLGAEYLPPLSHPRVGAFISGQMFFCSGEFLKELPFDPFLPDLFFGEEILLTLRFYTHGYDIFTPNQNIIYHSYTRDKEPKYWVDKRIEYSDSINKTKYLVGMVNTESFNPSIIRDEQVRQSIHIYGMGNQRSVSHYWNWIGLDPIVFASSPRSTTHRIPSSILDTDLTKLQLGTSPSFVQHNSHSNEKDVKNKYNSHYNSDYNSHTSSPFLVNSKNNSIDSIDSNNKKMGGMNIFNMFNMLILCFLCILCILCIVYIIGYFSIHRKEKNKIIK